MGAVKNISDGFQGRVDEHDSVEVFDFVAFVTEGTFPVFVRELVTAKTREQRFVFEGLTEAQAQSESPITVTDASGVSWTITPKNSITDGSSGTKVMIKERVDVKRTKISPHLYRLTVTRKGSAYFVNGSKIINGPSWYNPS